MTREGRWGGDGGQIMVLVLAYALIALTLVIVVVDITAVYLQRDQLFSIADATALNAANALDRARFYRDGPGGKHVGQADEADPTAGGAGSSRSQGVVPVSDETVRESAGDFLRGEAGTTSVREVALAQPTGTDDGLTAEVTVVGRAHLPLFSFVVARWARGVPLRVTARARADVEPG